MASHLTKARDHRKPLLAIVFAVSVLVAVGCGPSLFISSYDQPTDTGVTALQKEVDGLMDQLAQTPLPDYAAVQSTYKTIDSDLASLYSRNQLRSKNTLTVQQFDALTKALADLESNHKSGKLVSVMVSPAKDSLDQTFRAILKLEIEKKQPSN